MNGRISEGNPDFGSIGDRVLGKLPPNGFAYQGRWQVSGEKATAVKGSRIDARFQARRVFLVLGSPGRERRMRVLLDGRPIPDRVAGEDVHNGVATIGRQRLYRLVDLPKAADRIVTLEPERGISGYAFTFG